MLQKLYEEVLRSCLETVFARAGSWPEELSGNGLEWVLHNFPAGKKKPPGEAAKPKDDEVEQSSGRSGAGIRDSCSSSGRKLNGASEKCLIIRFDIDYRQGWLEGKAADCYFFARSAYGRET